MKKIFIPMIAILGVMGIAILQVSACECEFLTLDDHLMNADVVFQGTITREPVIIEKNLVATFSAIDVFKNPPPKFDYLFNSGRVNVTTGIDSGNCGVDFRAENTYIIFGTISEDKIYTSSCSGTATIDNYLEQILRLQHYDSNPYEQFKSGVPIDQIQCKNDLYVLTKRPNGKIACVYPLTAEKLGWKIIDVTPTIMPSIFEVLNDDRIFDVEYHIKGGVIKDIVFSNNTNSLLVTIDSTDKGSLILDIPRNLLDSKFDYCPPHQTNPPDDRFIVLLDREEASYDEILTTPEKRTLQIPFAKNAAKIEVISTCLI